MNIKEFLKPNIFKIIIFLFVAIFYLYFASESICGAGFIFAFCYDAYGFPFPYLIKGDIGTAEGHIKTLFLGNYFNKTDNFLFNPLTLFLNLILTYLLSCFISMLFKNMKFKT